jgi:hypothetical protein
MDSLSHLSSTSKKKIQEIFVASFKSRKRPISTREVSGVASLLSVDDSTAKQVRTPTSFSHIGTGRRSSSYSRGTCTAPSVILYSYQQSLYYNFTDSQLAKFLSGLNPELTKVIVTVVSHYLPEWKAKAITEQVCSTLALYHKEGFSPAFTRYRLEDGY